MLLHRATVDIPKVALTSGSLATFIPMGQFMVELLVEIKDWLISRELVVMGDSMKTLPNQHSSNDSKS